VKHNVKLGDILSVYLLISLCHCLTNSYSNHDVWICGMHDNSWGPKVYLVLKQNSVSQYKNRTTTNFRNNWTVTLK